MASWIVRVHKPAMMGVILLSLMATGVLLRRGLVKDYSLAAFVATRSVEYETFRRLTQEFVSNELALIAIACDNATSEATLKIVHELTAAVRTLPAVQRATSLADIPAILRSTLGDRLYRHPLIQGTLISHDGKSTAILLNMAGDSGHDRKQTVTRLKQIVADARTNHPDVHIYLAGPYVTLIDMYDYVDRDLRTFSLAAFALLLITLALVFRRVAPSVFALVVSGSAVLVTLGFASVIELPTALITQMVVILVMVLSVATCVHLGVADDEEFARAPFLEWPERARRVLRRMAAPCTAVIVTTATGFGSVSISSIAPVRNFGFLMVFGLLVSLILALLTAPILSRFRLPAADARVPELLSHWLQSLGYWVDRNRKRVFGIFTIVVLGFAASLPFLRFESDFVKNFRRGSEVRKSYEFIEQNLSPTGSLEVVVRRVDGGPVADADCLAKLRQAGERVVEQFAPVRKALTLADVLTLGPGGTPSSSMEVEARLAVVRTLLGEEAVRGFLNESGTASRINFRVVEGISVDEKLRLRDAIAETVAGNFGPQYETEVTGLYPFYATLVAQLWKDQFYSLGLTLPAVLLVLIVVLRSVKVGLVAMIPTALPVMFCLGAMGWTGIAVNMTTATMLSVSVGIAVDDAVHYLWRFRAALAASGDYRIALRKTQTSVGRACVFTTIVITGGFAILVLSQFVPTAYFGGLLAFTMACALAANLVLLPALIMAIQPFGRVRSG